jgi:hypothetical protein
MELTNEIKTAIVYMLRHADGEDMQEILNRSFMNDQMLKQLVMCEPMADVQNAYNERLELEASMTTNSKPIHIVYYSQVIDNDGHMEASSRGEYIFNMLNTVDEWTDDIIFEGPTGQIYHIDDLVGKSVYVPNIGVFTVPDDDTYD